MNHFLGQSQEAVRADRSWRLVRVQGRELGTFTTHPTQALRCPVSPEVPSPGPLTPTTHFLVGSPWVNFRKLQDRRWRRRDKSLEMRAWRAGKEQGRKLLVASGHPTLGYVPSGQAGSRAGLWRPRRAPLPCLPSHQVAEGQNRAQSKKNMGGEGVQVLGWRLGKGWFAWIWLGEREGSQVRRLWGGGSR